MAIKRKNNKFNPIKLKNKYKTIQMLAVVVVFVTIGAVVLTKSFAATATYGYSYYGCKIYYETTNSTLVWHPTVQYSSTGACVKELQSHLNKVTGSNFKPLYSLSVDGIFGSKTLAATKDFQKRKGLVVDGIVGPKTWRQLHITVPICHIGPCD